MDGWIADKQLQNNSKTQLVETGSRIVLRPVNNNHNGLDARASLGNTDGGMAANLCQSAPLTTTEH